MLSVSKTPGELQAQRAKLTSSYKALLDEFSSQDLRTIGNYTLGRLIGKGSFGKVYLATHNLTNGSKVVLKSAKKEDSNLAREVHHHRQFIHPHIARLYEVIVTESHVWLALEYCAGDELYHYLTLHGPIEPTIVQKIFTQLVGAVTYVHGKSCVHRDLKLENILLDNNQDVKLCDFGFTREYEGKSSYLQTWCGTVCYSAPEMLKGEKYAGEKVDVWSLGVILYALLCGELPFDEDDEHATKIKILQEEPKYPESMPPAAKELIALLLSKRTILRPSLAEILTNPWLSEHGSVQQEILKIPQPLSFTTTLEKNILDKMHAAGANVEQVVESVNSQRCDALSGWWALLLAREQRKERRRSQKRKDRESARSQRRASLAADAVHHCVSGSDVGDKHTLSSNGALTTPDKRGRESDRGSAPLLTPPFNRTDGRLTTTLSHSRSPSRVAQRTARRPPSATRRRSQLPPADYRKQNSHFRLEAPATIITATDDLSKKRPNKTQSPFFHQLASIKSWFKDSTKLKDSTKFATSPQSHKTHNYLAAPPGERGSQIQRVVTDTTPYNHVTSSARPDLPTRATFPARPAMAARGSSHNSRRYSRSPGPLTPQSSYRRSSNLRGRKSTSSSISSIHSLPVHHQSKASSTSSNSAVSPSISRTHTPHIGARHDSQKSVKVIPAAPPATLPSGVRVVLAPAGSNPSESYAAFSGFGPPSPGLKFARRKRSPFKGPMLGPVPAGRRRSAGDGVSRNSSVHRRTSGEIIEEEDEDVEEVEQFSPVDGPGEFIVEES